MNDVARNLKRIRERRGMSQETVAAQLHTTRQTISNWERGQTNPSIDSGDTGLHPPDCAGDSPALRE